MAIKFEENDGSKPAKKEVGGKTYVAEEPVSADKPGELPFGKPVRPEKKPSKAKR